MVACRHGKSGMLMRPAKCEAQAKPEARYHKAEAKAWDAVLSINY